VLLSLALIVILGFLFGGVLNRMGIPGLIGMIVAGVVLGPTMANVIDPRLMLIAPELRQMALIVILLRAGLALDLKDLKAVGRPAVLMSFVPATLELVAVMLLANGLLGLPLLDGAILGAILAAVSPAVVVPRMLSLMEHHVGQTHKVPQLIMAGASADDLFVIMVFSILMSVATGNGWSPVQVLTLPTSIILGIVMGYGMGWGLVLVFKRIHIRDTVKVLVMISVAFLMVALEPLVPAIPYSGLLGVMSLGVAVLHRYPVLAKRITGKFAKIWVAAELMLFALVGAAVDFTVLRGVGLLAVVVVVGALFVRMIGVQVSLLKTPLTGHERLFAGLAYLPKATVQAAIGSIPLAMGLPSGALILSVAVLAIVISAPLGAIAIDRSATRLLGQTHTRP
jgi:solute carrier family 9B (sodium/hydrogen exchanger), member 1/2